MSERFNGANIEDSGDALWYVIHTFSGYENKVASSIEQLAENRGLKSMIQEVRVPTEMVKEIGEGGAEKMVEHKIFPGYVLVKMIRTNETWYLVRNVRGCTGFVGPESEPIPLTPAEVERMGIASSETVIVPFEIGYPVKVVSGPFEGHLGTVESIDTDNKKAVVTVSMFGRETPIELDFSTIVPTE